MVFPNRKAPCEVLIVDSERLRVVLYAEEGVRGPFRTLDRPCFSVAVVGRGDLLLPIRGLAKEENRSGRFIPYLRI